MALEATLVEEYEPATSFTVADGAGIEKGSVLMMTDLKTAAVTTGDTDIVAGIAAEEKIANDGKTKLAVYRRGIFKMAIGAAGCSVGDSVITDTATGAANEVVSADVNSEQILGIALETATDTETALIELGPRSNNLA